MSGVHRVTSATCQPQAGIGCKTGNLYITPRAGLYTNQSELIKAFQKRSRRTQWEKNKRLPRLL